MNKIQSLILITLFGILTATSAWLQFDLLDDSRVEEQPTPDSQHDYYMINFTSTGMDASGRKYLLEADRLAHYPSGDRALLDNPHIIQYDLTGTPSDIYADSGWLYNTSLKVLLTGNVRFVRKRSDASPGGTATTDKMLINLKQSRG